MAETSRKAISADELAGHFNLWLLAGCLPGRLRRGQTVLLPKCAEAGDPAKYRPMTMSDIVVGASIGSLHSGWKSIFHSVPARKRFALAMAWPTRFGSSKRLSNTIRIA